MNKLGRNIAKIVAVLRAQLGKENERHDAEARRLTGLIGKYQEECPHERTRKRVFGVFRDACEECLDCGKTPFNSLGLLPRDKGKP